MLNCCFLNKPLATILLMSASMSPIYAAEESRSRPSNGVTNFITDSSADISLRNQFKNLNSSDYGERSVQTAWGQRVILPILLVLIHRIIKYLSWPQVMISLGAASYTMIMGKQRDFINLASYMLN